MRQKSQTWGICCLPALATVYTSAPLWDAEEWSLRMRLLTLLTAMAVMVLKFASTAPATVQLCSNHPNQQSAQAALDQDPS